MPTSLVSDGTSSQEFAKWSNFSSYLLMVHGRNQRYGFVKDEGNRQDLFERATHAVGTIPTCEYRNVI